MLEKAAQDITSKFKADAAAAGFTPAQIEFLCRWFEERIQELASKSVYW